MRQTPMPRSSRALIGGLILSLILIARLWEPIVHAKSAEATVCARLM